MLNLMDYVLYKQHNKLVKYINEDTTFIKLKPLKHEMKNYYSKYPFANPDIILSNHQLEIINTNIKQIDTTVDTEESQQLTKVFPNPTKDIIRIALQSEQHITFKLSDINGKIVQEGVFNEVNNELNLKSQPAGNYILTMMNSLTKEKEYLRIIKID
jgi:hypothetical protein